MKPDDASHSQLRGRSQPTIRATDYATSHAAGADWRRSTSTPKRTPVMYIEIE